MSENMNSDEHIQLLYNKTKNLKSPTDLDSMILRKIREPDEKSGSISTEKSWVYLPIAASILVAVFLQFKGESSNEKPLEKPVEIVQLPVEKKSTHNQKSANKNQLPEIFFLPNENINSKIAPACNGEFIEPDSVIDQLIAPKSGAKRRSSNIPFEPIYPNNAIKNNPVL